MRRIFAFMSLCVLLGSLCQAQVVKVKGKGEVIYKGIFKQGSTDERAAINEAKKSALARYAAGLESARYELYKKVEPEVMANLDEYVIDYVQIDQQVDKTSKRFMVIIEASVNATLIESTIQRMTTAENAGKKTKTRIVALFVARELAGRKIYDAKRTDVVINESSRSANESDAVADDGQSLQSSATTESTSKKTSGGNTEIKVDTLTYKVSTVTEVDNAVNSVLAKANYRTITANDVGVDMEQFKSDFSSGDDIKSATRRQAIKVLGENRIRYFAVANMDVGMPENDEVSGQVRVYVTVTAKVEAIPRAPTKEELADPDYEPEFPETVASIAGKPYAGLGPNPQVARQNALNDAATQSAIELTDQLRSKNIH